MAILSLTKTSCKQVWAALPFPFALILLSFGAARNARAVPSFSRQTHQPCATCHVGGFGPELTPFGRQFKLNGYTLTVGNDFKLPLSAALIESFTHTEKAQDPPPEGFSSNNNAELEQLSLFLAGRILNHLGVLGMATYSQNGGLFTWDDTEVRYARGFSIGKKSTVWGLSLNNNPGVSDIFNNLGYSYPYAGPDLAPGPPAAPIVMGGLGQEVVGLTTFMQLNNRLYAEVGGYRTPPLSFLNYVNGGFDGRLANIAPYGRIAYTWNLPTGDAELGAVAFHAAKGLVGPSAQGEIVALPGPTDDFTDFGVDGTYQFLNSGTNIVTFNGIYLHETQHLNGSFHAGGASNPTGSLDSLTAKVSYWYNKTYGITLAPFIDNGSNDLDLYGGDGDPDTRGGIAELSWNPFGKSRWTQPYANVRFGLQYTWYTRFGGLTNNVNNTGPRPADNNALFLYTWLAF